ncbi:hypothetical protein J6590_061127 [Homalodisca vitripennis]|nr:hypothetical protein J6590_061127 [Homalodisca vitripennis]
MYADDCTLQTSESTASAAVDAANNSLAQASEWFFKNGLVLNPIKTGFIRFTILKAPNSHIFPGSGLTYNNSLQHFSATKFLGLHLDAHLNWESHVDVICKRLRPVCYALGRLAQTGGDAVSCFKVDSNGNACHHGTEAGSGDWEAAAGAVYVNQPPLSHLGAEYKGSVRRDRQVAAWFLLSWQLAERPDVSDWIGLYDLGDIILKIEVFNRPSIVARLQIVVRLQVLIVKIEFSNRPSIVAGLHVLMVKIELSNRPLIVARLEVLIVKIEFSNQPSIVVRLQVLIVKIEFSNRPSIVAGLHVLMVKIELSNRPLIVARLEVLIVKIEFSNQPSIVVRLQVLIVKIEFSNRPSIVAGLHVLMVKIELSNRPSIVAILQVLIMKIEFSNRPSIVASLQVLIVKIGIVQPNILHHV